MVKEKKEKVEKEIVIPTTSIVHDGILYETIYSNGQYYFAYLANDPRIHDEKYVDYMREQNHNIDPYEFRTTYRVWNYLPQSGEEVQKNVVLLPSIPLAFKNIEEVINEIHMFIKEFCDIPDEFIQISTYYILLTYFYDRLDQIPYLSFLGDTGTGKSRCKHVIGSLCYLPIFVNAGASPAAIYRLIDKWHGTLVMDEADFKVSDETNEMVKLLNCGFERYSPRVVCDSNDANKLVFNNPFCPKIIARRFNFQDKAMESRCITQITYQTARKDLLVVLPPDFWERAKNIRGKLLMMRLRYWHLFNNPKLNVLADLDIEPRLQQAYTGLALVLTAFPSELIRFKKFLVEKNQELIQERLDTLEGSLVWAYSELVRLGIKPITARVLSEKATEQFGEILYPKSIGRKLKALGFVSKYKKVSGIAYRELCINPDIIIGLYQRYGLVETSETTETSHIHPFDVSIDDMSSRRPQEENTKKKWGGVFPLEISGKKETSGGTHNIDVSVVSDVSKPYELKTEHVLKQVKNTPTKYEDIFSPFKILDVSETDFQTILAYLKKSGLIMEYKPDQYVRL